MEFKEFVDKNCIVENFPCEGVKFIDIFPLLRKFELEDFKKSMNIVEPIVLVPEARGFLFYEALGPSRVIPLRKENKLPGDLVEIKYHKEYGFDKLYFQKKALEVATTNWMFKDEKIPVCIFDDILATGGTAIGIIKRINNLKFNGFSFEVTTAAFYIAIDKLNGVKRLKETFPKMNVKTTYIY